jgi:hypothetical protein
MFGFAVVAVEVAAAMTMMAVVMPAAMMMLAVAAGYPHAFLRLDILLLGPTITTKEANYTRPQQNHMDAACFFCGIYFIWE